MERVFNFAPGPSMLPRPVLEQIQKELLCYGSTGMSVMEMSHRSKMYLDIFNQTVADLREVMAIPDHYKVIFPQGGATAMFAAVAMNLMDGGHADYVDSGNFAHNALVEAQKYGAVNVAGSSRAENYTHIPDYTLSPDAKYVHITTNNTIYGTRWDHIPDTGDVPLVADMSSNILSEEVDVTKFGMIWAGAQKNVAPAGVTIAIIREDLIGHAPAEVPTYLDYKIHADNGSMYNTPPCFSIYVAGEVFKYLKRIGGIREMERRNKEKAGMLYDYIDASSLYKCPVAKEDRSLMNVVFVTGNAELDKKFVAQAKEKGLVNLAGHRSIGGMRASIYNAMPKEGVEALIQFMKEFEEENK